VGAYVGAKQIDLHRLELRFEATRISDAAAVRYFALIAKGDEVLDWREMTNHYEGARIKLLPAGDHALSDYEQHLDDVLDFLALV
jgi:predicted esterase YcpF (UPF0227 family)